MIKFLNPNDKKKKIKEAVKLLNKYNKINTNSVWGTTGTWLGGQNQTTWTINTNNNNSIFNQNSTGQSIFTNNTLNNSNLNQGITTTTTSSPLSNPYTTNTQPLTTISNPGNGTITINGGVSSISVGTGISAIGSSNISIGSSNTFVGYSHVVNLYKIFDTEVDLGFMPNAELVVSLINLLGVEFWDEYKSQNDLTIYYPEAYNAIETALKPKRRDQKIDDIINGENK